MGVSTIIEDKGWFEPNLTSFSVGSLQIVDAVLWQTFQFYDATKCATDKVAIFYKDTSPASLKLAICSVSSLTITVGTPVTVEGAGFGVSYSITSPEDNVVLVSYCISNTLYIKRYTISGTTPTLDATFSRALAANVQCCIVALSSTRGLLFYHDAVPNLYAQGFTTGSSTLTLDSDTNRTLITNTSSLGTGQVPIVARSLSSTTAILHYTDGASGNYNTKLIVVTDNGSGSAVGTGTSVVFMGGSTGTPGFNLGLAVNDDADFGIASFGANGSESISSLFSISGTTITVDGVPSIGDFNHTGATFYTPSPDFIKTANSQEVFIGIRMASDGTDLNYMVYGIGTNKDTGSAMHGNQLAVGNNAASVSSADNAQVITLDDNRVVAIVRTAGDDLGIVAAGRV